jgi:cell division protein FtsW (lipid II flippase)
MFAAYALAALLAWRSGRSAEARDGRLWFAIAATLLLLGLAKQVQLLGNLTAAIRAVFRAEEWYAEHHAVQLAFAGLVAVTFIAVASLLAHRLRRARASLKAAVAVLLILVAFVTIRATSIHAVDDWITADLAGMRRGWWAELVALAVISAAALAYSASDAERAADAHADKV